MGRSKKTREKFWNNTPHVCANCGSTELLEVHHIIPLCFGGNDTHANMIVLCKSCHNAAHRRLSHKNYTGVSHGGRPKKQLSENDKDILLDYIFGRKGKAETMQLLAIDKSSTLTGYPPLKQLMNELHISCFRNLIDIHKKNGAGNGRNGYVLFANGERVDT